jgi:2-succinyl-5-enolpyruvyl-6-hydroxy-3-cyclohexene-1-carboxylate synthase
VNQQYLYGTAVRFYDELGVATDDYAGQNPYWRSQVCRAVAAARGESGPVHLNIPFADPLVPDSDTDFPVGRANNRPWTTVSHRQFTTIVAEPTAKKGLVYLADQGKLAKIVEKWAAIHGWPVISETGGAGWSDHVLVAGNWLLGNAEFMATNRPEQVIVVGRPTVFRHVGQLMTQYDTEVIAIGDDSAARPGWSSAGHRVATVASMLGAPQRKADRTWLSAWQQANKAVAAELLAHDKEDYAQAVLSALPNGAKLVVGASNPTRDIANVPLAHEGISIHRNRGVAGIDGTISTAAGISYLHKGNTYALMGDLTFLHEIGGLWVGTLEQAPNLTIIVYNDQGGGIFSLLEQGKEEYSDSFERVFGTPHSVELAALCAGYGVTYQLVTDLSTLDLSSRTGLHVIEIRGSRENLRAKATKMRAVGHATGS